jgi:hypothetical protein
MGTWTRYLALFFSMAAVVAFYAWSASPGRPLFATFDGGSSYYNLLARGFRSGHLSLDAKVPAAVLELKDPYDPKQNAPFGMHDVSFYKGKFYLYFGPAPALVLYGPFAAIFGRALNDGQAIFLFCSVAFLAGAFLLIRIRSQYFAGIGLLGEVGGIIAIGLATTVPLLLRRQEVYEVAISSAEAFFVTSLFCLYQSLHKERGLAWLALASLSYGLAIASRATYLFGAASLLIPVLYAGGPVLGRGLFHRVRLARACAAIIPVGLLTAGILAYNDLRFDSPFEFGYHFAFSGANESNSTHFSSSFVLYNCRAYIFAPAHLSAYFPFVRVVSLPPAPAGYKGVEDPYGILPNIPFVLLALAAPLGCRNRVRLGAFALGAAISSLAVAAVIFSFQFAANRYMVDFMPGLVILGVVGFWSLQVHYADPARWIIAASCWGLLIWSVLFNLFASFGHNEFLRINNEAVFRRLVHVFDFPRYVCDRIVGRAYGPLELTVRFPAGKTGKLEPLVITGSDFLSDYLYLYYVADGRIRIGFEHTSYGGPVSEAIPVDYGQIHRIVVDMPPLYPPIGDPYFDGIPSGVIDAFAERLKVSLDGNPVIDTAQQFYPAFARRPSVAVAATGQTAFGGVFSGEIIGSRLLDKDWRAPTVQSPTGPVVISLAFPAGPAGASEPIVASGYAGRGDVLAINYIDANHATFSLDHWGHGGPTSSPFEISPGRQRTLEVRFGSFFPAASRPANVPSALWSESAKKLVVILDNKKVFEVPASFYAVPGDTVVVGRNSIGASSCSASFTGSIFSSERTLR